MEFTSGGTEGFRLDEERYNIPDGNNMYGVVNDTISKKQIATKFHELGWSVRKSSWTDFEIECQWAELHIEGENEILFNGILDETKFEELGDLMVKLGFKYSIELYDDEQKLLRTISN
ncbi:MAG: hypothetical protein AAGA80_28195 [Cyanobacteria bacterium P01_F01_bin.143]